MIALVEFRFQVQNMVSALNHQLGRVNFIHFVGFSLSVGGFDKLGRVWY